MTTYTQSPGKYAAVQWSGNAADLDAFLAVYDPNKRGMASGNENSWTYTVNPDGSLRIAGGFAGFRDVPPGEWMVCGPYWGTPPAGGLMDGVYGDAQYGPDLIGYPDADFQARFSATA